MVEIVLTEMAQGIISVIPLSRRKPPEALLFHPRRSHHVLPGMFGLIAVGIMSKETCTYFQRSATPPFPVYHNHLWCPPSTVLPRSHSCTSVPLVFHFGGCGGDTEGIAGHMKSGCFETQRRRHPHHLTESHALVSTPEATVSLLELPSHSCLS